MFEWRHSVCMGVNQQANTFTHRITFATAVIVDKVLSQLAPITWAACQAVPQAVASSHDFLSDYTNDSTILLRIPQVFT